MKALQNEAGGSAQLMAGRKNFNLILLNETKWIGNRKKKFHGAEACNQRTVVCPGQKSIGDFKIYQKILYMKVACDFVTNSAIMLEIVVKQLLISHSLPPALTSHQHIPSHQHTLLYQQTPRHQHTLRHLLPPLHSVTSLTTS